MNDSDLAAMLSIIAGSLERERQGTSAGILRQAARRLAEIGGTEDRCERCGKPLEQKSSGRRRRFCSESCRRRKRVGLVKMAS